ncbi:MAG TPA: radical SAM protein [Acidobacteriota bacterium]|nr:radical SAM protein [Acidobacteriota bacterium]
MSARTSKPWQKIPTLRSIYIYLTDECNQHCPHCWISPVLQGHSKVTRPSLEQYLQFIDDAVPLGLTYVKVTGGEPLLRPETLPIVGHASRLGAETTIETNAMLVGDKEVEFFAANGIHIGTSLDGSCPEAHDRRRGLKGAFRRTWRAVEAMTQAGINMTVTAAVSHGNLGEIDKILDRLRGIGGRRGKITFKINPIVPMGRAKFMKKRRETLYPHELLRLADRVGHELVPRYREDGLDIILQLELAFFPIHSIINAIGTSGAGHCGFLNLISLLADGSITFCGIGHEQRHLVMGNIRHGYDLRKIWEEEPLMQDVRRKVHRGLRGVCGSCLFHSVCLGGCRAAAVAVDGSLADSPPWCQSLYDAGLFPASRLDDEAAKEYQEIAPALRADYQAEVAAMAAN